MNPSETCCSDCSLKNELFWRHEKIYICLQLSYQLCLHFLLGLRLRYENIFINLSAPCITFCVPLVILRLLPVPGVTTGISLWRITGSVLVDAKQPNPVEGRQLGYEDEREADSVERKVQLIVLGVGAGQDEE
jgi:hypothetical protein